VNLTIYRIYLYILEVYWRNSEQIMANFAWYFRNLRLNHFCYFLQ
jgi:hypothetical protein